MSSTKKDHIFIPETLTKVRYRGTGLKQARDRLGLSLRELSAMTGISANYWHHVERGDKLCTAETKDVLLNALEKFKKS
jgi:transcriptional regulator with XRE-family HTH domain